MPDSPSTTAPLVVLIGAPGAGKTRIGKRIARLLGVDFIDTDRRIVSEFGAINEIFANHGEPRFREIERAAVHRALRENAVVALGGGAVLHPETQAELAGHVVVQLVVSADAVAARIVGDKRPLVKDGVASWEALVASRRPLYDRLATKSFDTSHRPAEKIAAEIAHWIQERTA